AGDVGDLRRRRRPRRSGIAGDHPLRPVITRLPPVRLTVMPPLVPRLLGRDRRVALAAGGRRRRAEPIELVLREALEFVFVEPGEFLDAIASEIGDANLALPIESRVAHGKQVLL